MGVVIDGCPAGFEISQEEIQKELDRRRPGYSSITSPRKEADQVEILSGVFEGKTLGTPIALLVWNQDAQAKDYASLKDMYRPGHADFTYAAKYGHYDWRGGGRASARETLTRVAAASIAKKYLKAKGVEIQGRLVQVGKEGETQKMEAEIQRIREEGDSIGGLIEIVVKGLPPGLGEPVFHKLSADLSAALMGIPSVKGVEIGEGFAVVEKKGSEHNDEWLQEGGEIKSKSNRAGGLLGGISTGEDLVLRFAVKPPSSIAKPQNTVDKDGKAHTLSIAGRHDPCVAPRAIPIGEAMVALVLMDHWLGHF